jgi:activator of HSP90 ATPase
MKDYKKYYIIQTEPETLYIALINPLTLELWTGEPAQMKEEVGTEFSLWDGSIVGKNLEFETGRKIVQQWYFAEQEEPSIVTIKLHPHKKGTSVELVHTNIPEKDFEAFVKGWDTYYFGALQLFYSP